MLNPRVSISLIALSLGLWSFEVALVGCNPAPDAQELDHPAEAVVLLKEAPVNRVEETLAARSDRESGALHAPSPIDTPTMSISENTDRGPRTILLQSLGTTGQGQGVAVDSVRNKNIDQALSGVVTVQSASGLIGTKGRQDGAVGLGMRGVTAGGGAMGAAVYGQKSNYEGDLGGDELQNGAGEGYRNAGVNPMTLTTEDPLSTFATDVDTGAFTLARRMLLEEGRMPNPDGVRVEEFINYPDWSYPTPDQAHTDAPVAVTLEAAPHPWQSGHTLVRVGLRSEDMKGDRKPANLVFLVDVSGSMQSKDKLPRARAALHTLVDSLGPADSVALVTYAGSTGVILEPTHGDHKAQIHAAIDGLSSGGGTAMGAGIDLAYGLARGSMRTGAENRVIVLSDGDANIGNSTPETLLAQIKQYAGQGITLSTIGFGVGNYQDAIMEQFADKGDGNYYYIDSLDEAERVFTKNLAGTIETVARDVKVQIHFDPAAVHAWRLVGYENRDVADKDFRNDKVDGGEMGSGQRVTVLYDVVLEKTAASLADSQQPLATVSFRAKRPGKDVPAREWRTSIDASDVKASFTAASADFRAAVGLAGFAELLRHSPYAGELTLAQVTDIIQGAARPGRDDGKITQMLSSARAMGGLASNER